MEPQNQSIGQTSQPMTEQPIKKCKNKNLPLIIALVILAVVGFGFGGFELWQNVQINDEVKELKTENTKLKNQENGEDITIDDKNPTACTNEYIHIVSDYFYYNNDNKVDFYSAAENKCNCVGDQNGVCNTIVKQNQQKIINSYQCQSESCKVVNFAKTPLDKYALYKEYAIIYENVQYDKGIFGDAIVYNVKTGSVVYRHSSGLLLGQDGEKTAVYSSSDGAKLLDL